MKKHFWIPLLVILWLFVLFIPIPHGIAEDGGTRDYISLTYRLVDWNRITADGVFSEIKFYFGADRNKSLDELFAQEYETVEHTLTATIVEVTDAAVVVTPLPHEKALQTADRISFGTKELADISAAVGTVVKVTYTGAVMESYPAQIHAISWEPVNDLRQMDYTETWLDKSTAETYDYNIFDHIKITKIYKNCFFARTVIPAPYEIKLNGTLSEDWCVGDQITATYTNTYYDRENNRVEVDFSSVEASNWQPDPEAAYKPVIYLYPEEVMDVSVLLPIKGKLTCTYPAYQDGWSVTAAPDGTLTDATGQTYNYLYWEGLLNTQYDMEQGFCVKGADTAAFLEDALKALGLTRREANEFIVYWLPLMEQNPYNIISFQTDAYTSAAPLAITPAPDTLIRVFMVWQPSDIPVSLPPQELTAPKRTGFTAVEWGGTEIS